MEIVKTFKDALTRQAHEAVRINNLEKTEVLNSKTEFNHPRIARITVERKNENKNHKLAQVWHHPGKPTRPQ